MSTHKNKLSHLNRRSRLIVEDAAPVQSIDVSYGEDTGKTTVDVSSVLVKIGLCPNVCSLMDMDNDFNSVGLTIWNKGGDEIVLCKIVDGLPSITSAMDDYIIIGTTANKMADLSDRMIKCLTSFIHMAASAPTKVRAKAASNPRSLLGQSAMTSSTIRDNDRKY